MKPVTFAQVISSNHFFMNETKKIIVLNGSPRPKGNTSALIESFTKGAESAGHSVTTFRLNQMNIHGCIGCLKGGKDPLNPCIQKDDMAKIYPVYEQADVVVLASPMYYWSISGQLKCAFDRLFAVAEKDPGYQNPVKDCIMLMAAEGTGAANSAPIEQYFNSLTGFLGWKNRGLLIAGGVMAVGDIKGHPSLSEAEKLGNSI